MSKPTLVDVGREAGVSAITVSRALRSPDKVSPQLRARVEAAVRKLGYMPNQAASRLASSRTNSVVVLIPSVTNNVFSDVVRGIQDCFEGSSFILQIGYTKYDPALEESLVRNLLNPTPNGVILAGLEQTPAAHALLARAETPVVQMMDTDVSEAEASGRYRRIGFSHRDAGATATQHLWDQGYRQIGFLGAQMDPRSQKRLMGYRDVMAQHGLGTDRSVFTSNHPSSIALGADLFARLVAQYPQCDAVFCNNDDLAVGVLFECQRRGLRVPQEMGICGYNNLGVTAETVPTISTIITPLYEIGYQAGQAILDDLTQPDCVDLGFKLAARESTARSP